MTLFAFSTICRGCTKATMGKNAGILVPIKAGAPDDINAYGVLHLDTCPQIAIFPKISWTNQ